ncbi:MULTISPECIES: DUF4307 domain-containing protein [unclassified Microbacterium]|uniref:DUF4307 domain-containing protein n=1 Tax=unclassified Microbacterium TaxID=2609290 RepID=UPI0037462B96
MTQQMLDERYGRTRSTRRRLLGWVIVGVVAAALIGYVGWGVIARSVDEVSVDGTGYDIPDAHRVSVSFQITSPQGRAVACALEAQDEQHGIVGWRIVQFPASDDHARAFVEEIPTVALATTGLVNSCWVT